MNYETHENYPFWIKKTDDYGKIMYLNMLIDTLNPIGSPPNSVAERRVAHEISSPFIFPIVFI